MHHAWQHDQIWCNRPLVLLFTLYRVVLFSKIAALLSQKKITL